MVKSYLSRYQPHEPWSADEINRRAAQLWHETGGNTLLVWIDTVDDEWGRQALRNIGTAKYGDANG